MAAGLSDHIWSLEEIITMADNYLPKPRSSAETARPLQEEAASMISTAIGKVVDRLPLWGKVIFYVLTLLGSVYCIAHYGFFHFLLRVIFSP
jgi:hypothetical protein